MSLGALAADEVRRIEIKHTKTTNQFVAESIAKEESEPGQEKASNPLEALVQYIPKEIITLYIAASSVMGSLKQTFPGITEVTIYWSFVVLTPIIFLLLYGAKRREKQLKLIPAINEWPVWRLLASTTAFGVWALAVPTSPYLQGTPGGEAIAAFGALLVSTFLTLLDPIFGRKTE